MVDPETVRLIRELHRRGWGLKRVAREVGVARNTVRRYLSLGSAAECQVRPTARCLDDEQRAEAIQLLDGPAEGNAVVVARLLRERGIDASLRTVERAVAEHRRERRAADVATVRFETAPGEQMQIDFGEKRVPIAGALVRVLFFVAVLSFSRRIFAFAMLAQRQDDWREGLMGAFRHFGGVVRRLLIDNAGPLVVGRDSATDKARLQPAFAAFCRDVGVEVSVCRPYRARTKGKTERGVGFVKHNAIAGLQFTSFAALQSHLGSWCLEADERIHGTTHEQPRLRFEREERGALRPLPAMPVAVRERRLQRRVASDCLVDVDTVRYSVPHRHVRRRVEVLVLEDEVRILLGGDEIARHRRSNEPHSQVTDPAHFDGLWRRPGCLEIPDAARGVLAATGRSLADYAAVVAGGAL